MFTDEYWKAATQGQLITVMDNGVVVSQVTVSPSSPVQIIDRHSPPTLTATACIHPARFQWYQTDASGGFGFKKPIPGASGMTYTFPNPVTCDSLGPQGYFVVEVFDEGGFPHLSDPVYVYGDCQ